MDVSYVRAVIDLWSSIHHLCMHPFIHHPYIHPSTHHVSIPCDHQISQSLSPELRELVESGEVRIEITSVSRGSVVVQFIIVSGESYEGLNVSGGVLSSLLNSSVYAVDKNSSGVSGRHPPQPQSRCFDSQTKQGLTFRPQRLQSSCRLEQDAAAFILWAAVAQEVRAGVWQQEGCWFDPRAPPPPS